MYGEDAAFGTVCKETDAALGIVNAGLLVGNTRALGEKSDVVALFQNLDGGFDGFQVARAAIDGDRTEGGEDLSENRIFKSSFFAKK